MASSNFCAPKFIGVALVMTTICQIGTNKASAIVPIRTWRDPTRSRIPSRMATHFLKEWRQYREMTLEQAAEASDLSHSVITRLENNRREYSAHHLVALAKAYRCSEPDLLQRNPLTNPPGRPALSAEIVSIITEASPEEQKTILRMIKGLRQ